MMKENNSVSYATYNHQDAILNLCGDWNVTHVAPIKESLSRFKLKPKDKLTIDAKDVNKLDTAGALVIIEFIDSLQKNIKEVSLVNLTPNKESLYNLVKERQKELDYKVKPPKKEGVLYTIGYEATQKLDQAQGLTVLVGDLSQKIYKAFYKVKSFQVPSIFTNIYTTGITALPIIALLSFLIGVVLAYQMGLQLETYGANIYIAYLSGMAIFREFSPLITAIIVAGRTSSAFTAQIGSMKINEEIDALYTMGLSPTELLVIPKVIALLIFFPLLIFWSDVFSTLGAMIMSKYMLQVSFSEFLSRIQSSVGLKQLLLGLYKAPTFAILIALVGCFQGFRVKANADSIGSQTTKSVVQALFLIIVVDAFYSIVYSWMDL